MMLLVWVVVLGWMSIPTIAEYLPDELEWSADACNNANIAGQFELCATLEFCQGSGEFGTKDYGRDLHDTHNTRGVLLRLRGLQVDSMYGPMGGYSGSETPPDGDSSSSSNNMPTEGTFGWRLAGQTGCISPGPTIYLTPGTKYGLFVKNAATDQSVVTNLHTHGLHIAGTGNADDVMRTIAAGDTSIYNLTLVPDHMGGTFWYHSHHHPHVKAQVAGGAFGMLIVKDALSNIGTTDANVLQFLQNEKLLIVDNARYLDEATFNGIRYYQPDHDATTLHLTNDEWFRFRILHVNIDSHSSGMYLQFDQDACVAHSIAHDGILRFKVPNVEPRSKYFLASSSRLDVAVKCTKTSTLTANSRPLATLNVLDHPDPLSSIPTPFLEPDHQPWDSYRPLYLTDLRTKTVDHTWTVDMYETSINDIAYHPDTPLCDSQGADFAYASVEEWTLLGTPGHPFHVHIFPMQVVGDCGDEHDQGEFYDTVVVQTSDFSANSRSCKVRLNLLDFVGHVMMHCHILQHSDQGAMGYINVVQHDEMTTGTAMDGMTSGTAMDGMNHMTDISTASMSTTSSTLPVIQPTEPRVLTCTSGADNCDVEQQVTHCVKRMPMVHSNPSDYQTFSEEQLHDMELQMMDMDTTKTIESPTSSSTSISSSLAQSEPSSPSPPPSQVTPNSDETSLQQQQQQPTTSVTIIPPAPDQALVDLGQTELQSEAEWLEYMEELTTQNEQDELDDVKLGQAESTFTTESTITFDEINSPPDQPPAETQGSTFADINQPNSSNSNIHFPSLQEVGLDFSHLKDQEHQTDYKASNFGGTFDTRQQEVDAYWNSKLPPSSASHYTPWSIRSHTAALLILLIAVF